MLNTIQRSVALLFALPAAAFAAPVTIVTHTAGTVEVNPDVLGGLGATSLPNRGDRLPYTLTITSNIDWTQPLPARDQQVSPGGSHTIDLRVGDFTYHSTAAHSSYYRAGDVGTQERPHYAESYYQNVGIITAERGFFEDTEFTNRFDLPVGALGGGALTPLHVEGGKADGVTYGGLDLTYSSPWWDGGSHIVSMYGSIDAYSIDVTSPVPEPAAFGMFAVGVLTLGLRRRMGRQGA